LIAASPCAALPATQLWIRCQCQGPAVCGKFEVGIMLKNLADASPLARKKSLSVPGDLN